MTASPPPDLAPASPSPTLPPVLRDQHEAPTPRLRGWWLTILPAYLGVLAWFPLLDGLGAAGPSSGVGARFLSAAAALVACQALLYLPMATLGVRTRRRMTVVAAGPLGCQGAEWIAGVLYGLIASIWCSTAIAYSVRLILEGLVALGLVEPSAVVPRVVAGLEVAGPLALICLAFWTFIILAANGLGLMGAIAAMMRVYAPFAALLLVGAAAWGWAQGEAPPASSWPPVMPEPRAFQYLFSAFSFAGLMAVDWGAVVVGHRDVRLGGWAGILGAGAATILAGLTLASLGPDGTIQGALSGGLGGSIDRRAAGTLMLLFGLASLAPACFTSALFSRRVRHHWPALRGRRGVLPSFLLILTPAALGWATRVEWIAGVSGALLAPLAGVLAAELARGRGRSTPMRPGWNAPGVAAWGVGAAIALTPVIGTILGEPRLAGVQPASLFGYLAAAIVYLSWARAGDRP